jgi:hypothetical protein
LQESRKRAITINIGKGKRKERLIKSNLWLPRYNTCKAIVTLIPAADDPGSPWNETHERLCHIEIENITNTGQPLPAQMLKRTPWPMDLTTLHKTLFQYVSC